VESNLSIKTSNIPKFNVKTVSSAVFGKEEGGSNIGGGSGESIRNIHKTLSKLSGHVRKALVRIKALEGKFSEIETKLVTNIEKTTEIEKKSVVSIEKIVKIEKILEKKKDNIGGNQDNLSKSLIETNKILVGIQQQLALQSSNEQKEQKTEVQQEKREKSKKRLKAEESALEKTAKGIGRAVTKTVKKIISPIGNIFDTILEFITLLGAGIAVNAAFEWFKDPKNREKITKFFNILKQNWKLLRNILLTVVAAGIIIKVVSALTALGGVLAFLANPVTLAVLATLVGAMAIPFVMDKINEDERKKLFGEGNMDKGLFVTQAMNNYGRRASKKNKDKMTDQEKKEYGMLQNYDKILQNRQTTNQELYAAKKSGASAEKISKLEEKLSFQDSSIRQFEGGAGGVEIQGQSIGDLFSAYKATGILPQTSLSKSGLQYREKGGPVTAKTPYLVGEKGPEIFTPNIDGSIVNNMRTEKIYQMISSGRKGRGGINMINLPPITNQMPPPEIPVPQGPATEVPDISSVNMADPYRQITPMLYGITV